MSVSLRAVGTSSMMLTVSVPVAVSPVLSVTTIVNRSLVLSPLVLSRKRVAVGDLAGVKVDSGDRHCAELALDRLADLRDRDAVDGDAVDPALGGEQDGAACSSRCASLLFDAIAVGDFARTCGLAAIARPGGPFHQPTPTR